MYDLLIKIMVIATLADLGVSASEVLTMHKPNNSEKAKAITNAVLHINWKPISVFPGEAKKFRK